MMNSTGPTSTAVRLRELLGEGRLIVMPCCYDALSAKLIEAAGFPLTFMSGFAVAASRLALPDTGLISYGEMLDQGRTICEAVTIGSTPAHGAAPCVCWPRTVIRMSWTAARNGPER